MEGGAGEGKTRENWLSSGQKLLPTLIEPRVTGYVDPLYVSTPDTHQAHKPGLFAGLIAFRELPGCPAWARVPHSRAS